MKLEKEVALLEAVLFLENDPVDVKYLAKITNFSISIVQESLEQLREIYSSENRGLEIADIGEGFQLIPKTELWEYLKDTYGRKNENKLSKAALETLSIIAYSQPVTRGEIENIRGVSPDSMMKLLINKNFIKDVGKKDVPGKPSQYGTTKEFLKAFRLSSIADLPKLDEIEQDRFELNG
ncbi:MAG: SMC-Scp complex subunit ScpB [Spirochaetia bacterium]|jgi:segregation and condensation protein B|nr:SMC-Scp complex subunit ScpB [Spirochaetia bacterium]